MCICTHTDFVHVGTYVTKVQSFSEYDQSWVHACPTLHCIVGFYFSVVGFFPSCPPHPLWHLKPLFHSDLYIVLLSKLFLFYSHFVIQTALSIIALRNKKVCVMIKAPLFKSYTFPYYPSNWRLWKVICCHWKKKKTYQNLQLQYQAFKTRIQHQKMAKQKGVNNKQTVNLSVLLPSATGSLFTNVQVNSPFH